MKPMPSTRVGDSANAATTASVGAVSEMSLRSTSIHDSLARTPRHGGTKVDAATHVPEHLGERNIALERIARGRRYEPDLR